MSRPAPGDIVLVDWRGGSMPGEPRRIRPGVVVEGHRTPDDYPVMIVVPLTTDEEFESPVVTVRIEPSAENGGSATSWALGHHVNSVSVKRVKPMATRVTSDELQMIRAAIATAIGF